ncbi:MULTISPECIES: hypothetical protein [Kitasatospora]|uniref:Uncharacterized protein n=1 Tax=Kitasatospora cystarginea TaxID=58350 RepID=A0ABN3EVR4_9ACTN
MADTYANEPSRARQGDELTWPWVLLGLLQLLAATPMLTMILGGGLVAGVMGLASGGTVGAVVLLALLLVSGPALGLALPALMLLSPAVRRGNRAALFALHCCGLLLGTAIEYFCWIAPAMR